MEVEVRFGINEANVIFERFGEEVVAIHLGTGCYFSLPGVSGDAFVLLSGTPTVSELAEAISAKYEAPAPVIADDLSGFLRQLKEESLIVEAKGANGQSGAAIEFSGARLPYAAPAVNSHRDLENLFLVDPVHDASAEGWPHRKQSPKAGKPVRYRLASENCLIERFDEASIALNLHTGAYFSFSGPAEDILLLLHNAPMPEEIIKALATKYVASEAQLAEAVDRFLTRVAEIDLVIAEEIDDDLECRSLTLAKPGEGLRFETPEIDIFRDAPAVETAGDESERSSSLLSGKRKFHLNREDNVFAFVSDGAVAVDLVRGNYLILNSTAARVLRMLEQEPAPNDIVSALESGYLARRPELVAAVIVLLRNFVGLGVATAEPSAAEPVRTAEHPPKRSGEERVPFEAFSVEMRQDLREQICLYPNGRPPAPEPASRGLQLSAVLEEYFEEARGRAPLSETRLLIAGRRVRVRCLGDAYGRDLSLALAHLRHEFSEDQAADLTIHVWDGGVGGPSNALLSNYLQNLYRDWIVCCGSRGELRGFHSPSVPAFYIPGAEVLNLVDVRNRRAFFFKKDESPLPYWEAGSPFRNILHAWLSAEGIQFIHGGAVGDSGGGVLLAGRGGSGKSTTTLRCLEAGMVYAGDDYCAVDVRSPLHLHSIYNTAKLLPQDVDRFPKLRPRVWNPQSLLKNSPDKAVFFLADAAPELMSLGFPLRAILAPRVTGGAETYLTPCGPAAALAAIAPSTVGQLQCAGQPDMDRIAAIVSGLPAYTLHLGSDISRVADVVRSALR
jgi:hypothetical protein